MLLLIDNEDSFTFNIVAALKKQDVAVEVVRYDRATKKSCLALDPQAIVIGPGPGHPSKSRLSIELMSSGLPILGICMGHQLIGSYFGAKVRRAHTVCHGKQSWVEHWGDPLFEGISSPFLAMRYHSLVIDKLPSCLEVIAKADGEVMAIRHSSLPIVGVQFHPDSIGTEVGDRIFSNYIAKSAPK
ncbi:MAG: Anthranilate synthase component 2 [Chlamydiales bacterium]|nr:Anthranilate synthase component 2 [Chlamydiales bacterium]MCH9635725.1 Anthranilate synthase component 2 [Chlamydiales bacterium]MCH9704167.1 aminodeoxychorismate/anthranilate synthase component II [Chlamydiota bacterium]